MNISKLASTVIMATCIGTLILFAFIFYLFYGGDQNALEKAFTITSGFFGGIATLVAAYIGTQLFNDWRSSKKFDVAKETLLSLVRLKSHIDKNYTNAKFNLDSYFLQSQTPPPSSKYIDERIKKVKNSTDDIENYKKKLDLLLIDFFEKVDIFEITLNKELINKEDKEFNFRSYMYFISSMYKCAYIGDLDDIQSCNSSAPKNKKDFEEKYYNDLFKKLSEQANLKESK